MYVCMYVCMYICKYVCSGKVGKRMYVDGITCPTCDVRTYIQAAVALNEQRIAQLKEEIEQVCK